MIPIIGQRLFAPKPAGAVAIGKASLTIYGRSSTKLLNMSRHTDGSLEPHPLHHIPIVAEEVPATASVASVDPQPPTASVHSHEGEPAAFTHTPDGEECFGTTVDAAFLASLIDYHNEPIEVQLGLDQAMSAEWQNYTEFNAVVPCTDKEVLDLMKAGHVCVPAKWVLTDRNEHLRGTPEYTPKWKARLVPKHPKGVPDPEIQQAGYMIARVPVYGTTDAGRNLYLRIKQSCKEFGLRASQILSALYFITGEDGKLCAAIAHTLCGREYVQHADGTIQINCRDNTHAIRPIDVHKSEKEATPVSSSQRTALRSVIGSLAWVARATRPDLAYRVKALQQQGVKATATVETLRDANRVVALALNDAERCITYKAKLQLPWSPGELAVVTFCDASFAGESEHKSRKGRFRYLTSAKVASDPDATHHEMHLIAYSSSTMKRVAISGRHLTISLPLMILALVAKVFDKQRCGILLGVDACDSAELAALSLTGKAASVVDAWTVVVTKRAATTCIVRYIRSSLARFRQSSPCGFCHSHRRWELTQHPLLPRGGSSGRSKDRPRSMSRRHFPAASILMARSTTCEQVSPRLQHAMLAQVEIISSSDRSGM
eukprot:s4578_g6.t1